MSNILNGALPFLWALIVGVVFVVVIVALPGGLLSLVPWIGKARRRAVPTLIEAPPTVRPETQQVLRVEALDKQFGSLKVLRGVAFSAGAGDLLSLIGPNGAGKTTLMRCIADGRERNRRHRGGRWAQHRPRSAAPMHGAGSGPQVPRKPRCSRA